MTFTWKVKITHYQISTHHLECVFKEKTSIVTFILALTVKGTKAFKKSVAILEVMTVHYLWLQNMARKWGDNDKVPKI